MNRRNSDTVMTMGSRKSTKAPKKTRELTMNDLERVYGKVRRPARKNVESPLPDRLQAAWNGSRSVAFTPEDWRPNVFEEAQSQFDGDEEANVRADAMAIRGDLKKTLASALDTLESGTRLFFGLSATMFVHREAMAFVSSLVEDRLNILKTLVKKTIEQAKKPLVVARLLFNTSCNYLGLPGHLLRNFADLVVEPVARLWWQKQSRMRQEAFQEEAAACPAASAEERAELGQVQAFFLSRLFAKFIAWFIDAKFDVRLDENAILREFFEKGTQRSQKIAIAKAIFMGTPGVDLGLLIDIVDVLDDHSIVKIFRAVRMQLQPWVPSRKTRTMSSNIIGNLNANRTKNSVDYDNYGGFSVF